MFWLFCSMSITPVLVGRDFLIYLFLWFDFVCVSAPMDSFLFVNCFHNHVYVWCSRYPRLVSGACLCCLLCSSDRSLSFFEHFLISGIASHGRPGIDLRFLWVPQIRDFSRGNKKAKCQFHYTLNPRATGETAWVNVCLMPTVDTRNSAVFNL